MENLLTFLVALIVVIFLSSMFYLFFKSRKTPQIEVSKNNLGDVPQVIDMTSLSEKYPGVDKEELYYLLEKKEENEEFLTENEKNFLSEYGWEHLGNLLRSEYLTARKDAIVALVKNNYVILPDEFGNPHKEIVNFALQYYNEKLDYPGIENEIDQFFPIMKPYILSFLFGKPLNFNVDNEIDIQLGFNEFSIFLLKYLNELNLGTQERNNLIRAKFKNSHGALIQEIDGLGSQYSIFE